MLAALLSLSAFGSAEAEKSAYVHIDKPYEGIEFALPYDESISFSYRGDGFYENTTEMSVDEFKVSDTDGWQIYVTGNLWSDRDSNSINRQDQFAAFFSIDRVIRELFPYLS